MSLSDGQLQQALLAIGWEDFERLLHRLVRQDHPTAKRVRAPDGGADVIVRDDPPGAPPHVFQAKHYTSSIGWAICEGSLSTAVEEWEPGQVTFVFPRNLTKSEIKEFERRLEKANPDVLVDYWDYEELAERLEAHDDIRRQFFPNILDYAAVLDRLDKAGGAPLETPDQALHRQAAIMEYMSGADPLYETAVFSGPPSFKPRVSAQITAKYSMGSDEVTLGFNLRDDVVPDWPVFPFTNDGAGLRARVEVREALLAGSPITVDRGISMPDEMTPQVLKGLVRDGKELTGLRVSYKPQEPWHLVLVADPDDRAVKLEVDLAIVPSLGGEDASFAGRLGNLTVEMRVNFTGEGLQVFEPSFDYDFVGVRADDFLQFAHFQIALLESRSCHAAGALLPDEFRPIVVPEDEAEHVLKGLRPLTVVFEKIALIERECNVELPWPEDAPEEDQLNIHRAAEVLTTGVDPRTFGEIRVTVHAEHIAAFAEEVEGHTIGEDLVLPIFGCEVNLGREEVTLRDMRVVDVVPLSDAPMADARVTLKRADDQPMQFRLIREASESSLG